MIESSCEELYGAVESEGQIFSFKKYNKLTKIQV
jgi:hypothetical protein